MTLQQAAGYQKRKDLPPQQAEGNYQVKDYVTKYPIEWEEKAFKEVLQKFWLSWQDHMELFRKLSKENDDIETSQFLLPSESYDIEERSLVRLFNLIIGGLICPEPYLCRCLAYINIPPEGLSVRQTFFEKRLQRFYWQGYNDFLYMDVLKDSNLAKQHQLTGIPLLNCGLPSTGVNF